MDIEVIFGATLVCLIVTAIALAVGHARGRPLLGGGCRTRLVAGGLLPGCEVCPSHDAAAAVHRGPAGEPGGSGDAQRA